MQDDAIDVRQLIDNAGEQFPAHVGRRLELLVGAGTGGAQQVAPIGCLEIKANRLLGGIGPLCANFFEIPGRAR